MSCNTKIGIVTAAGYTSASKYYARLHGLLDAVASSDKLTPEQRTNLIVMGGESNFLFKFSPLAPDLLEWIPRREWILPSMLSWTEESIQALLDTAEQALKECIENLSLPAIIIRKSRAVGIIHATSGRFPREALEEAVLVVQKILEMSPVSKIVPFCAFNGGNDVFVDIGDKSWGVLVCQRYFGGVEGSKTLHVGDQFLSAGANDFKARVVGTTAWIASPAETIELLDEVGEFMEGRL
jgi:IMP and pyridine-specific 5'-nucleotidase